MRPLNVTKSLLLELGNPRGVDVVILETLEGQALLVIAYPNSTLQEWFIPKIYLGWRVLFEERLYPVGQPPNKASNVLSS